MYYVILVLGILVSGSLFLFNVRKKRLSVPLAACIFVLGLALACFFAKSLYVLLNYSALKGHGIHKWFLLIPEQFSFVGGAIGFCLAPVLLRIKKRREIPVYLDQLALPGCLLAAVLRFDEIFLGELGLADLRSLGLPDLSDGSVLACFPFAVRDTWGVWYLSVSTLAALLALVILCCLALSSRKGRRLSRSVPDGFLFERCAFLLCSVRFFLELTRIDCLIFYFVHVDQVLAALVMLVLFIRMGLRLKRQSGHFPVVSLVLYLLSYTLNGIIQYLMDKPWHFESLLPQEAYFWLNRNLNSFGFSVLLLTTIVQGILFFRLYRKAAKAAGDTPAA